MCINTTLIFWCLKAILLGKGKIDGPEDVAIDSEGRIYSGTQDGKIIRLLQDDTQETFAETKGRLMWEVHLGQVG